MVFNLPILLGEFHVLMAHLSSNLSRICSAPILNQQKVYTPNEGVWSYVFFRPDTKTTLHIFEMFQTSTLIFQQLGLERPNSPKTNWTMRPLKILQWFWNWKNMEKPYGINCEKSYLHFQNKTKMVHLESQHNTLIHGKFNGGSTNVIPSIVAGKSGSFRYSLWNL